jgi:hypothetical protein
MKSIPGAAACLYRSMMVYGYGILGNCCHMLHFSSYGPIWRPVQVKSLLVWLVLEAMSSRMIR